MSVCFFMTSNPGLIIKSFQYIDWIVGIATTFLSPIIFVGNVLVIASILLDPHKNIRNAQSSYILFNLALADLLVGIVVVPLYSTCLIEIVVSNNIPFYSNAVPFTAAISYAVSLYNLIALTVDRLIAIRKPLQYSYLVTKKRIININISMWFCSTAFAMIQLHWCKTFVILSVTHGAITLAVLIFLSIALLLALKSQGKKIKKNIDLKNQVVLKNAFTRERTVARTSLMMVSAFEFCISSYIIFSSLMMLLKDREISLNLYHTGTFIAIFNCLMNPFLYAWRLPKYRKAFQYILNLIKKKTSFF